MERTITLRVKTCKACGGDGLPGGFGSCPRCNGSGYIGITEDERPECEEHRNIMGVVNGEPCFNNFHPWGLHD